jgi:molybdenum cofactor cytidylyltransferase
MLQNGTRDMAQGTVDIAAVVLAAGASTRMGRAKALLPLDTGDTFVGHVAKTLLNAGAGRVVVVSRSEWSDIAALLPAERVDVVINPVPERGQFSSLQCGLSVVPSTATAVLLALVDVPLVKADTIRLLIQAQRLRYADVVRPERAGRRGHPVLVTRAVAEALLAADSTETTRSVLSRFAATTIDVPVDDEGVFADVDTPEEYERLMGRTSITSGRPAPLDEG